MRRVYDVFERFPDGSTLWRASVQGRFEAERNRQELTEHSGNDFFLMDVETEHFLPTIKTRIASRPVTNRAVAG
jgi:hypothetical protein